MSTPQITLQLQQPELNEIIYVPLVGLLIEALSIEEGSSALIKIKRRVVTTGECSVEWTIDAPGGLLNTPAAGSALFAAGVTEVAFSVGTNVQTGTQGERPITIKLANPVGCTIDPSQGTGSVMVRDKTVVGPGWWKTTNRSGRNVASGIAYEFAGGSVELANKFSEYETQVAYVDAVVAWTVEPTTAAVIIIAPVNTTAPSVTSTGTVVGSVLTCNRGVWANSPDNYYYAWHRDGVAITPAQAGLTYTAVTADLDKTVSCWVTAANVGGSAAVQSNGIGIKSGTTPTVPGTKARPKRPPVASKTWLATAANLQSVYNNSSVGDGDHIVCADGSYIANYNFDRNFNPDNPVVIRSANPFGAVFTKKTYVDKGRGNWLYENKYTYQGSSSTDAAVNLGSDAIVTRCWVHAIQGILMAAFINPNDDGSTAVARSNVRIGWCRFTNSTQQPRTWESSHILINKSDLGPSGSEFTDCAIYRNCFNDSGAAPAYQPGDNTHSYFHIYIGNSKCLDGLYPGMPDRNQITPWKGFFIEENFAKSTSTRPRFIYLKHGVEGVYRNYSARKSGSQMGQRTGRGSKWYGNRIGGGNWEMQGGGQATNFTDMRCNIGGTMELCPGTENAAGAADHTAADWYQLYFNNSNVRLAERASPILKEAQGGVLDHVRIYAHQGGSITIVDASAFDEATYVKNDGNPLGLAKAPVVTGVTDANGTVLTTFGETDTGLEVSGQ